MNILTHTLSEIEFTCSLFIRLKNNKNRIVFSLVILLVLHRWCGLQSSFGRLQEFRTEIPPDCKNQVGCTQKSEGQFLSRVHSEALKYDFVHVKFFFNSFHTENSGRQRKKCRKREVSHIPSIAISNFKNIVKY